YWINMASFLFLIFTGRMEGRKGNSANSCCLRYVKKPLPQRILKSFEHTHFSCKKPGIIFITKKDRRICANPNEQWVQDRMKYLSEI
uniref:C-C motif chemokine n=1 Tax=Pseudonaja textilis TaxID=8673 RepID=A0A670ZFN1_PSETE